MTGTRGKRVKLSPPPPPASSSTYSIPIDPALTGEGEHQQHHLVAVPHASGPAASPSFESPNVSPVPQASSSNGGPQLGGGGGTDRAAERKERNRLAAQRSRDKRAAEFTAVSQECEVLKNENDELKTKLVQKELELKLRDNRIAELERIVSSSGLARGGGGGAGGNGSGNGVLTALGGGLSDLVHASNFLDQV